MIIKELVETILAGIYLERNETSFFLGACVVDKTIRNFDSTFGELLPLKRNAVLSLFIFDLFPIAILQFLSLCPVIIFDL